MVMQVLGNHFITYCKQEEMASFVVSDTKFHNRYYICWIVLCSVPDPDPTFHFDTVPNPDLTCHFDADPDPDPACHFDADADSACHFDADAEPSFHFDADADRILSVPVLAAKPVLTCMYPV
jgi:hypothetical protein